MQIYSIILIFQNSGTAQKNVTWLPEAVLLKRTSMEEMVQYAAVQVPDSGPCFIVSPTCKTFFHKFYYFIIINKHEYKD